MIKITLTLLTWLSVTMLVTTFRQRRACINGAQFLLYCETLWLTLPEAMREFSPMVDHVVRSNRLEQSRWVWEHDTAWKIGCLVGPPNAIKVLLWCRLSTGVPGLFVYGPLYNVWRIEACLRRCVHDWRIRRGILLPNMCGSMILGLAHLRFRRYTYSVSLYFTFLIFVCVRELV